MIHTAAIPKAVAFPVGSIDPELPKLTMQEEPQTKRMEQSRWIETPDQSIQGRRQDQL
ncbi:hypothetical protein J6590_067922 [Homalodisca vitripennis]|nr:hypothetical protein J6590_067922 [Homalodisca vitripennis]